MQLTLQLPQATCSAASGSALLDINCYSGVSTPTWTSSDSGPVTPPVDCAAAPQQTTHLDMGDGAAQQKNRSAVYRRLQLTLPCSARGVADDDRTSSCAAAATARRVLSTSDSYSSVCDWLDQQVMKRVGPSGGLIAACSHTPVDLDPLAWEAPSTPDHTEEAAAAATLPAPAFQLLGLL